MCCGGPLAWECYYLSFAIMILSLRLESYRKDASGLMACESHSGHVTRDMRLFHFQDECGFFFHMLCLDVKSMACEHLNTNLPTSIESNM